MEKKMVKIVYNACFGGYGLSHEAVLRYAELKGIKLYPELSGKYPGFKLWTYWKLPPAERVEYPSDKEFMKLPLKKRQALNKARTEQTLEVGTIARNDQILAQVVEELGKKASGPYADLKIEKLPEGTFYRIDEYDGNESVETKDSYDWRVA